MQSILSFLAGDLVKDIRLDQLRRYRWAFCINSLIWILQFFIVIFVANSLALLGDAAHSVSDTFVLLGTCLLLGRTIKHPEKNHEKVKCRLARGAVILLFASAGYLVVEGYERIINPIYFPGWPVVLVALIAAAGNFFSHRMIHGVDKSLHDHVHRANVLHILADLFISLAVVVSGLGSIFLNFPILDGWIALIVAVWMSLRGVQLFRETLRTHDHDGQHH